MIKPTQSIDTELSRLLQEVKAGKMQLPEFQRSWTWDDDRIRGIIASLSQGYPMGAIMRLQYGNSDIIFKYRTLEGVNVQNNSPEHLILDGQQRLTSIFCSTCSKTPVKTKTNKDKKIDRYYYFSIDKCLDESEDRIDAVVSIPADKKLKTNFDRDILLDISTQEKEFKHSMFPLNIIFDSDAREDWADGYKEYYNNSQEVKEKYKKFRTYVLNTIAEYKLPVITLDRDTPRDAVCKVFENVNTGGVALTVFELVTATFAVRDFNLRKDWQLCSEKIWSKNEPLNTDILHGIDETAFLTTITLYTSYLKHVSEKRATSCKKRDVLALRYEDYIANKDIVLNGFKMARNFLLSQYVFRKRDLPYTTQVIPLTAICAYIGESKFNQPRTQDILGQWFWCGILGEMYGGANETRYANDIEDVVDEINGIDNPRRTINAAFFAATRLLTLKTRLSAAYKGLTALIYREKCKDFYKGTTMDIVKSMIESPDIHHIFPESYCKSNGYPEEKWNCIVNKTPLLPESNRAIGGKAPSAYLAFIKDKANIDDSSLQKRIQSHLIDYSYLSNDDFDNYFVDRAKKILSAVEKAMGKQVSDRDSDETIKQFGKSLAK